MNSIGIKSFVLLLVILQIKCDAHGVTNGKFTEDSGFLNSTVPRHSALRVRRNSNDDSLDTSVDRMQKIARITNGIYLTRGLTTGTVPTDAFISELLRLGSVTPSQLSSMDFTNLESALEEITSIALEENDDVRRIEERYFLLGKVREETSKVGDVSKPVDLEGVKKSLETLKTAGIKVFEDFKTLINGFEHEVREVHKIPDQIDPSDTVTPKLAEAALLRLRRVLMKLHSSPTEIGQTNFEFVSKYDAIFEPIKTLINFQFNLEAKSGIIATSSRDVDGMSTHKENIASMKNLGSLFKSSKSEIDAVLEIFNTRSKRSLPPFKHAAGLINGASDLAKIQHDLSDPWVKSVIGETEPFSRATENLLSVGALAASADLSLGPSSSEMVFAIEKINGIAKDILAFADNEQIATSAIAEVDACDVPSLKVPKNLQSIKDQIHKIGEFKNTVQAKLEKIKEFAEYFSANQKVFQRISSLTEFEDLQSMYSAIGKLKIDRDLQNVVDHLSKTAVPSFEDKSSPTITPVIAEIINFLPTIQQFQTDSSPHVQALMCLQKVQHFNYIQSAIDAIRNVRKVDSETIQKGQEVVERVTVAAGDFKRLESACGSLKGYSSLETDALKMMKDPSKDSVVIGTATRGVWSMKNILKRIGYFEVFRSNLGLIQAELKTVKGLSKEDRANLEKLINLDKSFGTVAAELDQWKNGIKVSGSKKLGDQAGIFQEASKVSEINENLEALSASVAKLETLIQDAETKQKLLKVKNALEKLNAIGLKLSDYHGSFGDSQKSLQALDMFFVDFKRNLIPPPTSPPVGVKPTEAPVPRKHNPEEYLAHQVETTTVASQSHSLLCGFWIVLAILFIAILLTALLFWRGVIQWNGGKNKSGVAPIEETVRPSNKPVSPYPPHVPVTMVNGSQPTKSSSRKKSSKSKNAKDSSTKPKNLTAEEFAKEKLKEHKNGEPFEIPKEDPGYQHELCKGDEAVVGYTSGEHIVVAFHRWITEMGKAYGCRTKMGCKELWEIGHALFTIIKLSAVSRISVNDEKFMNDYLKDILFDDLKIYVSSMVMVPISMCRYTNETAVTKKLRRPIGYTTASRVTLMTGRKVIMMQSPREKQPWPNMIWQIVCSEESKHVVWIEDTEEMKNKWKYIPMEEGQQIKDSGFFKIKCVKKEELIEDAVTIRTLKITECEWDLDNQPTRTIQHIHYWGWPTGSVPKDTKPLIEIIKLTQLHENVIWHCKDGVQYSGLGVCAQYAFQSMFIKDVHTHHRLYKEYAKIDSIELVKAVLEVGKMRYGVITSGLQVLYLGQLLLDMAYAGHKIESESLEKFYLEYTRDVIYCIEAADKRKTKREDVNAKLLPDYKPIEGPKVDKTKEKKQPEQNSKIGDLRKLVKDLKMTEKSFMKTAKSMEYSKSKSLKVEKTQESEENSV